MRINMALTAVALTACASSAYAADCHFTAYNFQFGTDTSTQMTVKSGKPCGSNIQYGRGGGGSQMTVQQPAANGSVTTPTLSRWEYVSRRGYTGPDHFVVSVRGESMGRLVHSGTTQIDVTVDVVP